MSGGIKGIDIGQVKLDNYEGIEKDSALNSKGKFSNRTVRNFNNEVGSYFTRSHDLQNVQDKAQKRLNNRRINTLETHGSATQTSAAVSKSQITTNLGGKLVVDKCEALDKSINQLLSMATDPLASGSVGAGGYYEKKNDGNLITEVLPYGSGAKRNIIDPKRFAARIEKDLTVFLANTIKKTNTPHGLERLRTTIDEQKTQKHITDKHATQLNKLISKQYQVLLKNFPNYLSQLKAVDDSAESQHQLAKEKLEAIHEITIAANKHNPTLVTKHHKALKQAALDIFSACAINTKPHGNKLNITKDRLNRITEERDQLLRPVLDLTSNDVNSRIQEADQSSAASHRTLNHQLAQIPNCKKAMQQVVDEAVTISKEIASLERNIKTFDNQTTSLQTELNNLKARKGWSRIIHPADELKRKQIPRQQRQLVTNRTEKQKTLTNHIEKYGNIKEIYNNTRIELNDLNQKYGDSQKGVTKEVRPLTTHQADLSHQIESLEKLETFTSFDKACLKHYLDTSLDNNIDSEILDTIATEYVKAVTNDNKLPFQALKELVGGIQINTLNPQTHGEDTSEALDIQPVVDGVYTDEPLTPIEESIYQKVASEYLYEIFDYMNKLENKSLTQKELDQLFLQFSEAYDDINVNEDDLNDLAFHISTLLGNKGEDVDSSELTFEPLKTALEAGLEKLKQQEGPDMVKATFNASLFGNSGTTTTPPAA